mmetsp:Transcript_62849/g.141913  ORF Transcript_62849/g.141913 Transcript_62849/m.141913 type:complete len:236 (+) Transcript_62849:804-1511(+)
MVPLPSSPARNSDGSIPEGTTGATSPPSSSNTAATNSDSSDSGLMTKRPMAMIRRPSAMKSASSSGSASSSPKVSIEVCMKSRVSASMVLSASEYTGSLSVAKGGGAAPLARVFTKLSAGAPGWQIAWKVPSWAGCEAIKSSGSFTPLEVSFGAAGAGTGADLAVVFEATFAFGSAAFAFCSAAFAFGSAAGAAALITCNQVAFLPLWPSGSVIPSSPAASFSSFKVIFFRSRSE